LWLNETALIVTADRCCHSVGKPRRFVAHDRAGSWRTTTASYDATGWKVSCLHFQAGMAQRTTATTAHPYDPPSMPPTQSDTNALSVFPSPCAIAASAHPVPQCLAGKGPGTALATGNRRPVGSGIV